MSTILLTHIIIACSSLVFSAYVLLKPSKAGLNLSYALVAGMLATGIYLVSIKPTHLTQTCAEGLIYLVIVGYMTYSARNKLALTQPK